MSRLSQAFASTLARRATPGFTLVEVAICLVIVGLLTGLTVLSGVGLKRSASLDAWTQRLAALDRQTRHRAGAQGRSWRLVFDFQNQTVWNEPASRRAADEPARRIGAPTGLRMVSVHRATDPASNTNLSHTTGQVAITYSPTGTSDSYAVAVEHESGGRKQALLILGGSGQPIKHMTNTEARHDRAIQTFFEDLQNTARDDPR